MGPVWEDADGEEIVNETFTRLEKAFHGRTNWGLLLKVEAIIVSTTMIVAHLALHVDGRLSHRLLQRHSEDSPPFGLSRRTSYKTQQDWTGASCVFARPSVPWSAVLTSVQLLRASR